MSTNRPSLINPARPPAAAVAPPPPPAAARSRNSAIQRIAQSAVKNADARRATPSAIRATGAAPAPAPAPRPAPVNQADAVAGVGLSAAAAPKAPPPPPAPRAPAASHDEEYGDWDEGFIDESFDDGGWDDGGFYDDGGEADDDNDWGDGWNSAPARSGRPRLNVNGQDHPRLNLDHLNSTRGQVLRVQRYGEWGRGTFMPEGASKTLTIVGEAVAMLRPDDFMVLYGNIKHNEQYGHQFEVDVAMPDSTSKAALLTYLQRHFKGMGPVSAQRVVSHYESQGKLNELREQLIYSPSSLDLSPIAGRTVEGLHNDIEQSHERVLTMLSLRYGNLGIRNQVLNRLAKHLVAFIENLPPKTLKKLVESLRENKYKRLTTPKGEKEKSKSTEAAAPTPDTPRLSDEEYVGELMADYERMANLPKSGTHPAPVAAKAAHAPTAVQAVEQLEEEFDALVNDSQAIDHVQASHLILSENPYLWQGEVEGYGFKTADLIGQHENIPPNDPRRIGGIASHAVHIACESMSHTYIDYDFFTYAIKEVDARVDADKAIEMAVEGNHIEKDGDRYYPKGQLTKERELAHDIATRITRSVEPLMGTSYSDSEIDAFILAAQANVGAKKGIEDFTLDPVQYASVKGVLTSDRALHVIVGGPGRGKTAIVQVVMEALQLADRMPYQPLFCAPVGKAAKVLTNQIRDYGTATTMHSMLGARGTGFAFENNRENPLDTELLVADEQSMSGLGLAHGLFAATPHKTHMILLGDPNQLQSIDCGDFLRSVLALEGVEKYELIQPHRNRGQILNLVDQVTSGQWPVSKDAQAQMQSDEDVTLHHNNQILSPRHIPSFIEKIVRASEQYGGMEHVGVICPLRKGSPRTPDWNVTYLNEALRERLNPDPSRSKRIVGTHFRINDRVIITKNQKQHDASGLTRGDITAIIQGSLRQQDIDRFELENTSVINGDTGVIIAPIMGIVDGTAQATSLLVKLDDGRHVILNEEGREHLGLAYAITAHAAQGSEYKKVFSVVPQGHPNFMHRHLLMTGLSRAKESLEVFGELGVCSEVSHREAPLRFCAIRERAQGFIDAQKEADEEEQAPAPVANTPSMAMS